MSGINFIVITAARNESNYLHKTIESVVSQTILPREWVILDDGSNDGTGKIAEAAAHHHSWIKVVRRADRGYRDVNSGVVDAFNEGLSIITTRYEFIFKIDADIVMSENYFKMILSKFAENPRLGIASGVAYDCMEAKTVRLRALPESTYGSLKCWRRTCFEEIGGLVRGLGYDGIDGFKARILGWETKTFEDAELRFVQLRPAGASVLSIYHGWVRRGRAHYFMGTHPLWLLASAFYHMLDRPHILGGFCMIIGYLKALLKRQEQYQNYKFRRELNRWQIRRLFNILRLW